MCGFAGEVSARGAADVEAVRRMGATMDDRGPDGQGTWAEGAVALAHRRLKVIDLSERGAQPMVDEELGLTVAFNGCVYNYAELRGELGELGYTFASSSDTEVLLKAYHAWGAACVERLVGMFAFALVERESGRVVLARDRLGIKPLYLADHGDGLRFASTLPALLAGGGIDTQIDPVALHHYLTFHAVVPPPRTMLRGVRKLAPATVMTVEPDGERRTHEFWRPSFERDPAREEMDREDWEEAILESLRRAVDRRMVSDVPVGVLLSGGLDSTLIVGLLAEAGQTGIETFSVGFDSAGGREGDEFEWSDHVAREYETEHHRVHVSEDRMLPALEGAIEAMSEPMVSHDVVGFYVLSEEVAKEVKVVQSGQGADEVFAGYDWYPPVAEASGDGAAAYVAAFHDRSHADMERIVQDAHRLDLDASGDLVRSHFARRGASTPVDRALRLDTEVMLVDDPVKRVDNMTMAWGLEARTPFLDHDLVELAAACPPEMKLADDGKGVLKGAARRVIPEEVIDRPKGYFPVPALAHLEGPYLDLVADALHDPAARDRGLFRPEYVERLLAEPNSETTTLGGNVLWQLGLLELWLQAQGV